MRPVQKQARPRLLQAMIDAFKQPDLRGKILFTFAMLVIFRFVAHIPVPGVDLEELNRLFNPEPGEATGLATLLGMLDIFSGGALRNLSIAAMGVYPYITASIIMQLLVPMIPQLRALSREGEVGRNKLNQYTHWLMVPLAMLQGYGQLVLFQNQGVIHGIGLSGGRLLPTMAMVLSMTAGTVFLVWLGERITEHGIGNGVSIIIFGGIVASLPVRIPQMYLTGGLGLLFKLVLLFAAMVFFIVIFTEAHRRIPVQYSRSLFRGGRMYRQAGAHHIPLRVNSAGMIPLIFAMSILVFPGTVASFFVNTNPTTTPTLIQRIAASVQNFFSPTGLYAGAPYWAFFFLLVVGFTFFYTMVVFQQQNLAETLQRNGGFIPGIRPGRPTAEYLTRVLTRITWGGAIFLAIVAVTPFFSQWVAGMPGNVSLMILSSISLLIVVGVVLDTMRQLEAQLLMRHYEGFIR